MALGQVVCVLPLELRMRAPGRISLAFALQRLWCLKRLLCLVASQDLGTQFRNLYMTSRVRRKEEEG